MASASQLYGISNESLLEYIENIVIPCRNDFWRWIQVAYPWGQPGTVLEKRKPAKWQKKTAIYISKQLQRMEDGEIEALPIQIAVKSGHGIGKSTFLSWLNDWNVATQADARATVTANTDLQLRDKTWAEMAKWHKLSISKPFFSWTARGLASKDPEHTKNWAATCVPWSEKNPEAIAGLHNAGNRCLLVFDEASAIPKIIWETVMGAMTDDDTQIIWIVFGNPTRNSGPFYECFNKYRNLWWSMTIDSRDVEGTNKALFARWIKQYGDDSDFVRIRVKGQFPAQSAMQFISARTVDVAMKRPVNVRDADPLICGIDLARNGLCASVLAWRKGRDMRTFPPDVYHEDISTTHFEAKCAGRLADMKPDLIYGDSVGVGGPILDHLRNLGFDVLDVNGGWSAIEPDRYFNRRAEIWTRMKHWIRDGGALPYDSWKYAEQLKGELISLELIPNVKGLTQLEPKESLLARGEGSPDIGDAVANTFAYDYSEEASAEERIALGMQRSEAAFDQWEDVRASQEESRRRSTRDRTLARHYSDDSFDQWGD